MHVKETLYVETSPKQSSHHQNKLTIINVAIGPDYFSGNKIIYIKIVINLILKISKKNDSKINQTSKSPLKSGKSLIFDNQGVNST